MKEILSSLLKLRASLEDERNEMATIKNTLRLCDVCMCDVILKK